MVKKHKLFLTATTCLALLAAGMAPGEVTAQPASQGQTAQQFEERFAEQAEKLAAANRILTSSIMFYMERAAKQKELDFTWDIVFAAAPSAIQGYRKKLGAMLNNAPEGTDFDRLAELYNSDIGIYVDDPDDTYLKLIGFREMADFAEYIDRLREYRENAVKLGLTDQVAKIDGWLAEMDTDFYEPFKALQQKLINYNRNIAEEDRKALLVEFVEVMEPYEYEDIRQMSRDYTRITQDIVTYYQDSDVFDPTGYEDFEYDDSQFDATDAVTALNAVIGGQQNFTPNDTITTYNLTIEGEPFTLFVNETTGQVSGYGYAGFDAGIDVNSTMTGAQGVFVGTLDKNTGNVIGKFSGISLSSSTNIYEIDSTGLLAGTDAVGMTFTGLSSDIVQNGGSGDIAATIFVGDPAVTGNNVAQTLGVNAVTGENEPNKLDSGYNITPGTSTGAITYQGFAKIVRQDRVNETQSPTISMEELGDLKVVLNRSKDEESLKFSFNGSDPQATADVAVINDRTASAVNVLEDNMLRGGVMFPLDELNNVNLVQFVDFSDGAWTNQNEAAYGFGVVGTPTAPTDVPTAGSATYNGGAAAGNITDVQQFYGDTAITADFGGGFYNGTIKTFNTATDAAIENFTVSGSILPNQNTFDMAIQNGDLSLTGTGDGAFYGSNADEMAGHFTAQDGGGTEFHEGVFWGKK